LKARTTTCAAAVSSRDSFRAINRTSTLAWNALNDGSCNDGARGVTGVRVKTRRGAAHQPGLTHTELVGGSVLAYTAVTRERAALLREEDPSAAAAAA
jgi:hypothetical protein